MKGRTMMTLGVGIVALVVAAVGITVVQGNRPEAEVRPIPTDRPLLADGDGSAADPRPGSPTVAPSPPPQTTEAEAPAKAERWDAYPWLEDQETLPKLTSLQAKFPAPKGYVRVELGEDSFGGWLRGLPVRLDRTEVLSYRGDVLAAPSAAVVDMDVGDRDLQQCADSLLRLHAEYLWSQGTKAQGRVVYHFTSGDPSSWSRWKQGERFVPEGRTVRAVMGKARGGDHGEFRRYLQHLFRYAGTQSLRFDTVPVAVDAELEPGDLLVQPGGPGHAVMILDVAVRASDGSRVALVGQGFMPAQEFHVLKGEPGVTVEGVWFVLPKPGNPEGAIDTPSWRPFKRSDARRFK